MAQPSKVGPAFLTIFALPFLGGGLFFIYAQLISLRNFRTSDLIVGLVLASFFVLVGAGLILASTKGYALLKKQAALQDANPLAPWLWRADWASRRAESGNKKGYIGAWIAAAFCNLITAPFMLGKIPELLRQGDPRVFILLGFNLFGAILLINAIRATIRHERFGNSYFEFDPLPISPGQRLTGRIQLRFETQAAHGVDLRLSCIRRIVSGSGNNRSTSKVTLWQGDKNVPSAAIEPGPLGRAIPVDFALPADCLISDYSNPSDQVLWVLHAQADVPGVDYSDDFELPVFRTDGSPQKVSDSFAQLASIASSAGFTVPQSVAADSEPVAQPASTKVVVSMHDGGTEFYFPAFRTPGRALMLFVVSAIFTGAAYALIHSHVSPLFSGVFAFSDLFVIYGFLYVAFGSSRIGVGNGEILSRRSVLGIGPTRRTPISDVASIVPVASMSQSGNSDSSVYIIQMTTKSGKKFTLADQISNRQEARWVVSQLETLVGLKQDTHVEVILPLGVQARPTQVQTVLRASAPQKTASALASFGFFIIIVAVFFVWRGQSFSARSARVRASRVAAVAASRSNPVPRRVFSGPLSDADVERVVASPPQAQAEELFERLVGHDTRALEVFEQQDEGWIGHIRQSDRLAQLLQRAQFSNDLRIRLAHIDMSLALEGWQKNEHAADLLIQRAQNDPRYRAGAVYFLGMLAARGIAYDRIHQVVLEYARNDKDPAVRQWAVEGLRFLGKDEVLDELFTSFTEDPSMNVRDRAGCNISDCGIFTRKQRMRMVPKLIDLAANPGTNAQMRSWCFLALREITDENSPVDANAWNRWYAEHGSEKLAEFERLEWWQVRGDE